MTVERTWLDGDQVLYIHNLLIDEFGGAHGVRDMGLLESAIAKPQQLEAYGSPDVHDLAATLTAAIAQNHPFIDGNKRTSIAAGRVFLEQNGQELAPEMDNERYALINDFATGQATVDDLASHYRESSTPRIEPAVEQPTTEIGLDERAPLLMAQQIAEDERALRARFEASQMRGRSWDRDRGR